MKKRILSFLLAFTLILSALLGTAIVVGAEDTDLITDTSLNLAENITVNMQVAVPAGAVSAKITLPNGDIDESQAIIAGETCILTAEVAAKEFAKDITVEILDGSGVIATDTTTAKAYCDNYKSTYPTDKFIKLIAALELYCEAADDYFAKNSAELDDISEFVAALESLPDITRAGTLPEGIKHYSASLLLESKMTVRHYFQLADPENTFIQNYIFFVDLDDDGECDPAEEITPVLHNATNEFYKVDITGITPNEIDNVYKICVIGKADDSFYSCEYGPMTYLKRTYKESIPNNTKNLLAAIYNYNAAAGELKGTITFDANGGSGAVDTMTYEYGVNTPIVNVPTKDKSIFRGWFDADGNRVDTIPASATDNITLTAYWANELDDIVLDANKTFSNGTRYFCYDHVEGENGKCSTCGYCYDNPSCEGSTNACATCGKKAITSNGSGAGNWQSSTSYKWVGYAHDVTLDNGKTVSLVAKLSGTILKEQQCRDQYNNLYNKDGKGYLGTSIATVTGNVFAFSVELGIPSAEQYGKVEKNPSQDFNPTAKSANVVLRSRCTGVKDNVLNWGFVNNGRVVLVSNATATGIDLPVGTVTKVTFVLDFGDAVSGDGIADPFTVYLFDEDGNYVTSNYIGESRGVVDMSCFSRGPEFAQFLVQGNEAGRLLVGDMCQSNVAHKVIATDGSFNMEYTPGVRTALPKLENTEELKFECWVDENGNEIIDIPENAVGMLFVTPKWVENDGE